MRPANNPGMRRQPSAALRRSVGEPASCSWAYWPVSSSEPRPRKLKGPRSTLDLGSGGTNKPSIVFQILTATDRAVAGASTCSSW